MDYKPGCCLAMSAPALPVPGLEEVVDQQADDPEEGARTLPSSSCCSPGSTSSSLRLETATMAGQEAGSTVVGQMDSSHL